MTNKDKMIATFLVSVGVFSATQATQYVGTLSSGQKKQFISVVKSSADNVLVCSGVWEEKNQDNDKVG